jgi:hypothetical protein
LKEKVHATGFPDNCITDEQKDAFIQSYYDREGIILEKDKMIKIPGKREIEKLKLNSLWGFFALNSNKAQFKIITNRASLENFLNDDQYVIHDIDLTTKILLKLLIRLKKSISLVIFLLT